eukprot:m.141151 g.141151  ORF g.141151 m.141151 type:complete len:200 (+) comp14840_c0_seq1:111-710(+)
MDQAKDVIRRVVGLLDAERCCVSFNGGKDATVVFHLIREALPESYKSITYAYFSQRNEFPEIMEFLDEVAKKYNIKIEKFEGGLKKGLEQLNNERKIRGIFLGTRTTDPRAGIGATLELTDPDWPAVIRINPIMNWSYTAVWEYLRLPEHPYCNLYDKGYTSLGSRDTTVQNPHLKLEDGGYRAAYELTDGSKERAGRN